MMHVTCSHTRYFFNKTKWFVNHYCRVKASNLFTPIITLPPLVFSVPSQKSLKTIWIFFSIIIYRDFFVFQEAMMLMGLDNWLHACAWYLKSFVVWIVPLLILVFFITFDWPTGAVFQYSDPLVLMAILTLYVTAGISYCFLISACFKKGKI